MPKYPEAEEQSMDQSRGGWIREGAFLCVRAAFLQQRAVQHPRPAWEMQIMQI